MRPICKAAIGTAETHTPRALEVARSSPGVSVTSFLQRKCERSDPCVDFYSTLSRITIVNCLDFSSASSPLV